MRLFLSTFRPLSLSLRLHLDHDYDAAPWGKRTGSCIDAVVYSSGGEKWR